MIQLSVERIPRRVLVAVAILLLGSAITNAATPYTDRIKFGVDYCENVIQSSIQNYATTIIQWGLKNYTSGKAVSDMFPDGSGLVGLEEFALPTERRGLAELSAGRWCVWMVSRYHTALTQPRPSSLSNALEKHLPRQRWFCICEPRHAARARHGRQPERRLPVGA